MYLPAGDAAVASIEAGAVKIVVAVVVVVTANSAGGESKRYRLTKFKNSGAFAFFRHAG